MQYKNCSCQINLKKYCNVFVWQTIVSCMDSTFGNPYASHSWDCSCRLKSRQSLKVLSGWKLHLVAIGHWHLINFSVQLWKERRMYLIIHIVNNGFHNSISLARFKDCNRIKLNFIKKSLNIKKIYFIYVMANKNAFFVQTWNIF